MMDITNILELKYVFLIISFIQFFHDNFLNIYYVTILKEELYHYQLAAQQQYLHCYFINLDHVPNLLVFIFYSLLITLQQSIHIHNHILDLYLQIYQVSHHTMLIIQIQVIWVYFSLNNHTMHLVLEDCFILRSRLQCKEIHNKNDKNQNYHIYCFNKYQDHAPILVEEYVHIQHNAQLLFFPQHQLIMDHVSIIMVY